MKRSRLKIIVGVIGIVAVTLFSAIWLTSPEEKANTYGEKSLKRIDEETLFIIFWNKNIIRKDYGKEFLLPSDGKEARKVLNRLSSKKIIEERLRALKVLEQNINIKYLRIPIKDYESFILANKDFFLNFSTEKAFSYKKTNPNDIKKIVYLNDFKRFFKDNKKDFYKKGFSLNIKGFNEYIEVLKQSSKNREQLYNSISILLSSTSPGDI